MASEYGELRDMVAKHMGWDEDKANLWMETVNPHFGLTSPLALIARGRGHKVRAFIEGSIDENGPPSPNAKKTLCPMCIEEIKIGESVVIVDGAEMHPDCSKKAWVPS